jgi:hypothetical protein
MSQRFFELYDDMEFPHRWHLAMPKDQHGRKVDDWEFRRGMPVRIEGRLRIPIESPGRPLDFTEAGLGTPIVHVKVASIFSEVARDDVQLVPVDVEGHPDQYLMLVVIRLIRCIDERASRIRLWSHEDGLPDMVGKYASVRDLRVDKSAVGTTKVFRPEGWEGPLIVSGDIKDALERLGATGMKFEEV